MLKDEVGKGRLEGLVALRDRLASEIDGCESSRYVAALSNRLMEVLEQIAELQTATAERPVNALDELAARRAARSKGKRVVT